jgi:hypothetical protein
MERALVAVIGVIVVAVVSLAITAVVGHRDHGKYRCKSTQSQGTADSHLNAPFKMSDTSWDNRRQIDGTG